MEHTDLEKSLSHESLARLAQAGDREALAVLCRDYAPLVEASARRYLGWRTAWEDLLQIGYEQLLRAILSYDEGYGVYLRHFLKRRVHAGIFTDVRRRERELRRRSLHGQGRDDEEHLSWLESVRDEGAQADFLEKEWADAFAVLSPREALAIRYTVLMDYTDRELAQVYGVSRDTVKTWRKRGLAKLRKAWLGSR